MPKLKDFYKAINEKSGVQGHTNSEPESGYVAAGRKRKLKGDVWMTKGGYTQLHFPKADNPFGVDTQKRTRRDKIINPDLYIEPISSDNFTTDDETGEDFVQNPVTALHSFVEAAVIAKKIGLDVNAGHDLNLHNLKYLKKGIPYLAEVSIGHALFCDALYYGIENTIQMYKRQLQ